MKKIILSIAVILSLASCTSNQMAKNWGGSMTVDLPAGQKLINVTWKEGGNLWYLSKPMSSTDSPETYTFKEKSNYGIQEGTVVIKETK